MQIPHHQRPAFGRDVLYRINGHHGGELAGVGQFLEPTSVNSATPTPKRHIESWVHELSEPEFVRLQGVVYRVAKAIAAAVPDRADACADPGQPTGQRAPALAHCPLPPGVPFEQQQFYAS